MTNEVNIAHEVAQLAHVELYTPKLQESVAFFTDLLGMQVSATMGDSVYLRAYEDFYHHTLKLTAGPEAGLGHVAWRASSPEALERRAIELEASGRGIGWIDGDLGHGRAYQFTTPDGHLNEILWDVDYYEASEKDRTLLKSRPQKRPTQGVPVRRLDHVNLMCQDVTPNKQFMADTLGFKLREHVVVGPNEEIEIGAWMSVSPLVHEVAFMRDNTGNEGRFHHIAFWYGYPQHLMDIADLFVENNITIEAGPGKHGVSQAYFMYVLEPGGNRVELFGDSGYLIFDPEWKPIKWTEPELKEAIIWYGSPLPDTYFIYGTPEREPVLAEQSQTTKEPVK
ncbi:catechol 2,3-dioxygenase [Caryophanon latum]|uniref:Metapyrocatechase n=1 Tax=Caryophanon latum TaxID=33977 RepID=A0A1C0YTZ6_9BACL|nr:catechol 2,3-dioxygenase [Caryophanon latum]OCS90629.1 catechol 2,3-dioxygenase [Caryophanon latum]